MIEGKLQIPHPSFSLGDEVHWLVDLSPVYPRGVLCSRLCAHVNNTFPGIPESSQTLELQYYEQNENIKRLKENDFCASPTAIASTSEERAQVGTMYKVSLPLISDFFWHLEGVYELSLECKPIPGLSERETFIPQVPLIIAKSQYFRVLGQPSGSTWNSNSAASITDLTPLEFFEDSEFECAILRDRPTFPIRINNRHVYDRGAFLQFLEASNSHGNAVLSCPFGNRVDHICLDMHHYHKMQAYAAEMLEDELKKRHCTRERELEFVNLETRVLIYHDLGLDLDVVDVAAILLRQNSISIQNRVSQFAKERVRWGALQMAAWLSRPNGLRRFNVLVTAILHTWIQMLVWNFPRVETLFRRIEHFIPEYAMGIDHLFFPTIHRSQDTAFMMVVRMTLLTLVMIAQWFNTASHVRFRVSEEDSPMRRLVQEVMDILQETSLSDMIADP